MLRYLIAALVVTFPLAVNAERAPEGCGDHFVGAEMPNVSRARQAKTKLPCFAEYAVLWLHLLVTAFLIASKGRMLSTQFWRRLNSGNRTKGQTMKPSVALTALLLIGGGPAPAFAWHDEGHQLVGSIADQLLQGTRANDEVKKHLGFELRIAAIWLDCVRDVKNQGGGNFEFIEGDYTRNCPPFEVPLEKSRMEDYAKRNWYNCVYIKGMEDKYGCHAVYHFADVPIKRDRYDRSYAGTGKRDIVSAINAAIAVLKDEAQDPNLSIIDKKESLFLLAHLLGDLHQPLHIGAVYLDGDTLVDPATPEDVREATETNGGNALYFDGTRQLHVFWDDIPEGLSSVADSDMIKKAKDVAQTPGSLHELAAHWATDTLLASHSAYKGLSFQKPNPSRRHWDIAFDKPDDYFKDADKLKYDQLAKGGARLAELLKTIWP